MRLTVSGFHGVRLLHLPPHILSLTKRRVRFFYAFFVDGTRGSMFYLKKAIQ